MDDIGSLPELVTVSGGRVQVLAHEALQPYLTGQLPFVKSGEWRANAARPYVHTGQ